MTGPQESVNSNQKSLREIDMEGLVNAALKLEKEYTLMMLKLLDYTAQMEDLSQKIHDLLGGSPVDTAKRELFQHLFSTGSPLPDTVMDKLMDCWLYEKQSLQEH